MVCGGWALQSFVCYNIVVWAPSLVIIQSQGKLSESEVGQVFAIGGAVFGIGGTFVGGMITDYLVRFDTRWFMWVPMIAELLTIPAFAVLYFSSFENPTLLSTIGLVAPGFFFCTMPQAPAVAVAQLLGGPQLRGLTTALLGLSANILGLGVGPLLVGAASDFFQQYAGRNSLRMALQWSLLVNLIAAACYAWAGAVLPTDAVRRGFAKKDRSLL